MRWPIHLTGHLIICLMILQFYFHYCSHNLLDDTPLRLSPLLPNSTWWYFIPSFTIAPKLCLMILYSVFHHCSQTLLDDTPLTIAPKLCLMILYSPLLPNSAWWYSTHHCSQTLLDDTPLTIAPKLCLMILHSVFHRSSKTTWCCCTFTFSVNYFLQSRSWRTIPSLPPSPIITSSPPHHPTPSPQPHPTQSPHPTPSPHPNPHPHPICLNHLRQRGSSIDKTQRMCDSQKGTEGGRMTTWD